jgi:hypothetical protein
MKKTTEQKRYERALFQYKLALRFPFLKKLLKVQYGFCHHFYIRDSWDFIIHLPVLKSLEPKSYPTHWFIPGDLKPRIELLEKAIEICKTNKKIEL